MSTLPQSSNDPTPTSAPFTVPANGHIVCTPGTCGGKPRIDGTRIRVQDVVDWHVRLGQSVDEILLHFSHLKRADIYAALAYYYDHQEEMDAQRRADDEFIREYMATHPSPLQEKLKADPELLAKIREKYPEFRLP